MGKLFCKWTYISVVGKLERMTQYYPEVNPDPLPCSEHPLGPAAVHLIRCISLCFVDCLLPQLKLNIVWKIIIGKKGSLMRVCVCVCACAHRRLCRSLMEESRKMAPCLYTEMTFTFSSLRATVHIYPSIPPSSRLIHQRVLAVRVENLGDAWAYNSKNARQCKLCVWCNDNKGMPLAQGEGPGQSKGLRTLQWSRYETTASNPSFVLAL